MAGYALGFEDGGDVPDVPGEGFQPAAEDNSGAAPAADTPAIPDDNSGAAPVAEAQPQQAQPDQGGERLQAIADAGKQTPMEGIKQFPGNLKRIVSYLMGDNAAPPEVAEKFALGVKHEYPGINPDDANVLSVQKAMQMGGPAAAWQMMQFNRSAYNAKQAFAQAAMEGTQGKPPDAHAAADAATKASQHVLDGSQAHFTADDQGFITATVKLPGTDTPQTYRLSPQQFSQYANVGKDGQYDRVLELGGVPGTLQRIVGQPGKGGALPTQGAAPQAGAEGTQAGAGDDRVAQLKKVMGDFPISQDDINSGYDPDTIAKAYARFGHGVGQTAERNQWMADQEDKQATRENQVQVAQEKGKLANERAKITGTGRVEAEKVKAGGGVERAHIGADARRDVAETNSRAAALRDQAKAQLALKKMEMQSSDAQTRERGRMARAEIMNPNFLIQTDAQRQAILKKHGLDGSPAGAPEAAAPTKVETPPAAQAGPPQRPANVPEGAKFYKGKWYTRGPNGEAVPAGE